MNDVRLIAFYLPQYHPIPENDAWWGTGFTEWTNVTAARPVFPGHYQPHLPADLGYYDLRVPEVREAQAQLAREHGIHGFCYYYYYFNGKRLLHRPLDDMLASGKPDFPFCLCWANENWTRQWDGHHDDILIRQAHSVADDRRFIRSILPALKDPRYIRVDNRLLLLVYRPELLPEPAKTAEIWRSVVRKETGADLYICAVNNFIKDIDPRPLGYDATVQFPLDYTDACKIDKTVFAALHQTDPASLAGNWLINFPTVVRHMVNIKKPGFTFFRGAFPSWDNTARRADASTVYMHSSPELYKLYLKAVIGLTKRENAGDANLVFLNAWNEWAEGAHLEPDKKYGLRFLRATRDALQEETDLEATMKEIDDIDTESRAFYSAAAGLQEQVTAAGNRIHDLIVQSDSEREEHQRQLAEFNASLAEKEHAAAALAQLIEDKDRQIAAKDAQLLAGETILQEKETLAQQKDSHLATLAEQISILEARLNEKDDRITSREDQLQDKEDLIRAKEEQLQTKESLVQSKEDQLREREDRIRELDVRLHEQLDRITDLTSRAAGLEIQLLATENRLDAQTHLTEDVQLKLAAELSEVARLKDLLETSGDRIQSLLQIVSDREQANREMEAELETRQQILLGKERDISDLEGHLREGSDQLARAEALIREKESAISALGQQVADLQAVIQERTQRIGELETALLEKVRKVDSLNELLGRRDEEIRRLNNRMQALLTSLSWKITRPLRWSLDILFSIFYFFCPFGSKRWIIVKTLGRVLLHPVKFFREFHAGSLASFFGRLRSPGMEAHRQREQAAREASARPEPPRPPVPENKPGSRPVLPEHTEPEVLVVCYQTGQIPLTPCIRSVSEHSEKPFKFVVTGDLSFRDSDIPDFAYLAPGEIVKLLESTSAFRYVMLLHPDVRLMPGTVRTCTETLEAEENRGIVVPQVWNTDNMLESAGVVIWKDGCSSRFGTHEGPYDPEHLYLREVDTSDRFAMVKKQIFLWWVAGPRYTADPWPYLLYDLSMAARWWGSTVVYQPLARVSVAHSEEFSFPEAREVFYLKWQETLENNHLASSPDNLFLARERGQRKTYMLMIDHYVPTFDKDAGSRTMKAYMELFIDHGIVIKFIGDNFYPEAPYVTWFQQHGVEILYGECCEKAWRHWLKRHGRHFTLAFLSRPVVAIKYIEPIRQLTPAKILFYGHDLHFLRERRQYEIEKKEEFLKKAEKSKELEGSIFSQVDVVYYPSQTEIDSIRQEFSFRAKARAIIPYIFTEFPEVNLRFEDRQDIMFVGSFYHQPNIDAVLWFLDEVFPQIRQAIPDLKFHIVGSHPTEAILARANGHTLVTGFVDDAELARLYKSCRLVVAPLRYGAGVKGKIVEALYHGIPVVTTPIGAEGMNGVEEVLLMAGDAQSFAGQVIRHYPDTKRLAALAIDSQRYIRTNYSREMAYSIIRPDLFPPRQGFGGEIASDLKILFVSHDASLGGAQLLLIAMLKWFRRHTAVDIRILCNRGGQLIDRFREIGDTLLFSELEAAFPRKELETKILAFCGGTPDLIYGNTVAAGQTYHVLKNLGAPVITHFHELQMSIEYYAGKFIGDVTSLSRFYIAASTAVGANLTHSLKIPEEKIKVVHAFIEPVSVPETNQKEKSKLRARLGLDESAFTVIGCGVGLFWRKGGDLFIDTARQLLAMGLTDFRFYWVGDYDEKEKRSKYGLWDEHLERMTAEGLAGHVSFLGKKMNVMDYLKAGDLFILPSREDPFPLVCLEAAMCGLPVLCFRDAGGMPEFVEEDAGFVVPFEDTKKLAEKIVQLHDDPELRERLGRHAREKVHARHVTPIASPKILSACREISGKAPRVSVIVPNYNYGRFLEKRLDSILQQTFRDYEIILLDDGSTDNSREIIEKFTRSHEARVVINEKNGGSVFKQWYKGLSMARGEFIWMAEADDLAEPAFLERLLPFLNDREVNLVYCNSHVIDDAGDLQENFYFRTGYYDRLPGGDKWNRDYICSGADEINDGLGIKNIIPNASAVLFRRSAVTDIDQEKLFSFRCGGDWFIYLNTIRKGKLAYCAAPLNYHRRHRGSVVGKSVGSAKETIPDYYSIHRYILENFRANEVTLNKQIEYVTVELRQIWPQTTDKAFKKLYDPDELKRFFEENKILF